VAFILSVTIAGLIYTRPLILTWVGAQYESMTGATRLFLVYPLFGCVNQVAVPMLIGLGRVRRVIVLQIISVSLNLAVSIALAPRYGIAGVIIGTLVGHAVVLIPYNRMFLDTFGVGFAQWLREIALPNVPGPLVQIVVGLATLQWVERFDQFWAVVLVCAMSSALSLAVFARFGMRDTERTRASADDVRAASRRKRRRSESASILRVNRFRNNRSRGAGSRPASELPNDESQRWS